MVLRQFVCGLVVVLVVAAGGHSPAAGASPTEVTHATGHYARADAQPTCPAAERGAAIDGVRTEAAVPDCHDAMADDASCVAGHCALCVALPVALPLAVGERLAGDVAAAVQPLRPGRCTAPDTPPRIA